MGKMKEVNHLRDRLLNDEPFVHQTTAGDIPFQVLYEVEVGNTHYALMRGYQHDSGEAYLYQVLPSGGLGEIEMESEWEQIIDQLDDHLNTYFD